MEGIVSGLLAQVASSPLLPQFNSLESSLSWSKPTQIISGAFEGSPDMFDAAPAALDPNWKCL